MLKRDSALRAQVKEITERERGAGLFPHRAPAKDASAVTEGSV